MATDPVCGMFVDEHVAELKLVRENRTYYFCAEACLESFAAPEEALTRLRHRLAVAWPLAIAVALLTYLTPFTGWPFLAAALAAIVQFYPGRAFYQGTLDAFRNRVWNMDILIAVGTTVAFGYSVAALLLPGRLPAAVYFDASSLIIALILTGNYLEHLTRERARGSLRALNELLPSTASVLREGREVEVPVSEVRVGERVHVRPGGRFPTDGRVAEGRSEATESLLTGESRPVPKGPGDPVVAGAINGHGPLWVETTRVGSDTFLAQVGQLVAEAETSRVPLQQLADRIASVFVPVVLLLAVGSGVLWFLLGAGATIALLAFVSVAITACPCAFGIATPAAIVVGTGRAAEAGVLFKGRESLERAAKVDLVLTDKTGTLTRGTPSLVAVRPAAGWTEPQILSIAAALEAGSEHPLARAVRARAERDGLHPPAATGVMIEPGVGLTGVVDGRTVELGAGSGTEVPPSAARPSPESNGSEEGGETLSSIRVDGTVAGLLVFADEVAPGTREAIASLGRQGIPVEMVTGDRPAAAERVAREVGISRVAAGTSPAGKLEILRARQREGHTVAFVGDGVNDAPALAAADLGIAVGSGTDIARESGGVLLVRPGFEGVDLALRAGRATVGKVRGNLTWAIGYNVVLLPVAAGALVPFLGLGLFGVLPVVGAIAMALSSTSVVLNSLSLRRAIRPPRLPGTPTATPSRYAH